MQRWLLATLGFCMLMGWGIAASPTTTSGLERGKMLVAFGSCNDCHTPGWLESDGTVPESKWLTGSSVGLRGPWGTSYPANIRLVFNQIDENQWVFSVKSRAGHMPMHWHDLRFLSVNDQRLLYRFVKSLGPAGTQVPDFVEPWREPKTPYIKLVPQTPQPGLP